jgi:hypothetical protein
MFDFCPCLEFVAVRIFFLAGWSGKCIRIVQLLALAVLGNKILLLQALKPTRGLFF